MCSENCTLHDEKSMYVMRTVCQEHVRDSDCVMVRMQLQRTFDSPAAGSAVTNMHTSNCVMYASTDTNL